MQASGARHALQRPPPGSLSQHQTPDARREAAGVVPGLAGTRDWGETSRSVNAGGVTSGPPPLSPSQQHRGAADRPARAETPPWPQGGPSASPPARPGACADPDNRSRARAPRTLGFSFFLRPSPPAHALTSTPAPRPRRASSAHVRPHTDTHTHTRGDACARRVHTRHTHAHTARPGEAGGPGLTG